MSGIVVFDRSGDLYVFASERHAAGWMAAVNVKDGWHVAARLLDDAVLAVSTAGERVVLRRTDREGLPALMTRLRAHQRAAGRPESVGDLVAFANDVLPEK